MKGLAKEKSTRYFLVFGPPGGAPGSTKKPEGAGEQKTDPKIIGSMKGIAKEKSTRFFLCFWAARRSPGKH